MSKNRIIEQIETEQLKQDVPDFAPGDTVVVQVRVREGNRERLQAFEGVVIRKRNRGLNSAFTVRKISHGVGVERTFQVHSPQIESITVKRRGDVRQAKLYYLRELSGRKARIREKLAKSSGKAPVVPETGKAADPVAEVAEPEEVTAEAVSEETGSDENASN